MNSLGATSIIDHSHQIEEDLDEVGVEECVAEDTHSFAPLTDSLRQVLTKNLQFS